MIVGAQLPVIRVQCSGLTSVMLGHAVILYVEPEYLKEQENKLPDKFLIQSTIITPDRAHLALQNIAVRSS